jgi:hypothetical protein
MRKEWLGAIGFLSVLLIGSAAQALGVTSLATGSQDARTIVQRVHSLGQAEQTLHRLGYYDVIVERSSLPYSFHACKRGLRYHIHIDYYGTLVQVDRIGSCREYADRRDYYGRRSYYDRYRYRQNDY